MAAIFPPAAQGGVPPGTNVCNGFTPQHPTVGEGPLFFSNECSTIYPDCVANALISEILAAVDILGYPYNSGRITNLGEAIAAAIAAGGAGLDISGKVDRSGDSMTGPLLLSRDPFFPSEAATKQYVDNENTTQGNTLRAYTD